MFRDKGRLSDLVVLDIQNPGKLGESGYYYNVGSVFCLSPRRFKRLTDLPLPRKGTCRKVKVKLVIK